MWLSHDWPLVVLASMLASFLFFFWFDRDLCAVMACWCAGCCGVCGASVTAEEVAFRKYTRLAEEEREARRERDAKVANMMPHGVPVSRSAQAGRKVNVRLAIASASAEGAALAA